MGAVSREKATATTAAAMEGGSGEGGSGMGDFSRIRTRQDLQQVINNSITPFYVKKECIEQEEEGKMDEDMQEPETQLIGVHIPRFETNNPDAGFSSGEDSVEDEEMDPVTSIRQLYNEGGGRGNTPPPPSPQLVRTVPRLDHRYYVVKGLRNKDPYGRELSDTPAPNKVSAGFMIPDDDRTSLNSNSFRTDKCRNVSRSFKGDSLECTSCLSGGHDVSQGKGGLPVVFAVSDQHFSPNLPARDGRDCMKILRVEDGSLREIVGEFLSTVGRRSLAPGSVVLLGSLSQLAKDGTGMYAEEWHRCRKWLMTDLGEIMVLPLIPLPMEDVTDEATMRSLLEFFSWFNKMPDVEAKLLAETRQHYINLYMARTGTGPGCCDKRESFSMPTSLAGTNFYTYHSRNWGERPKAMRAFTVETEKYWADRIIADINAEFSLDLSTDLCVNRNAGIILMEEAVRNKVEVLVAGASNAGKLLPHLTCQEVNVTSLATPGWRLTGDKVADMASKLEALPEGSVLVLYGLDNSVFVAVDEDMRSGPPFRGRDGKHHAHGRMEVVTGFIMDRIMKQLEELMLACKGRILIIVTPMPRYWLPCCDKQVGLDRTELDGDKARLLREIGRFRRAISSLVMRLRLSSSIKVLDPLSTLEVRDDIPSIEQLMVDTVHLTTGSYQVLGREVRRIMELSRVSKRKHELARQADRKRPRMDGGRTFFKC
jgi:hypothetical protein